MFCGDQHQTAVLRPLLPATSTNTAASQVQPPLLAVQKDCCQPCAAQGLPTLASHAKATFLQNLATPRNSLMGAAVLHVHAGNVLGSSNSKAPVAARLSVLL